MQLHQAAIEELFADHVHVLSPGAKSTLHHKIKALSFFFFSKRLRLEATLLILHTENY